MRNYAHIVTEKELQNLKFMDNFKIWNSWTIFHTQVLWSLLLVKDVLDTFHITFTKIRLELGDIRIFLWFENSRNKKQVVTVCKNAFICKFSLTKKNWNVWFWLNKTLWCDKNTIWHKTWNTTIINNIWISYRQLLHHFQ